MTKKLLLLQVAALGYNYFQKQKNEKSFNGLKAKPLQGVFPSLTCPVQATMRTALNPNSHGITANGFFSQELHKPIFWEQNSRLVKGERIWSGLRANGGKVAEIFIQQSLGDDVDYVISPAPIHKHHGGMILDCYSNPDHLGKRLKKELGEFPLHSYWGPLAGIKSSRWISNAIESLLVSEKPNLVFGYIPHLDYDLQRYGPSSKQSAKAFKELNKLVTKLLKRASELGYEVIIYGDYAITPAEKVIYPNMILKDNNMFNVREVKGMEYPDLYKSKAFAMCDHQVAHIGICDEQVQAKVHEIFSTIEGIDKVLDHDGKVQDKISNEHCGELVLVAKPGYWFDYRWWKKSSKAPEYSTHVDIHQKPGYDPCELLFGFPPGVSQNPNRIKGTHGRLDSNEPVALFSTFDLPWNPSSLMELSQSIKELL